MSSSIGRTVSVKGLLGSGAFLLGGLGWCAFLYDEVTDGHRLSIRALLIGAGAILGGIVGLFVFGFPTACRTCKVPLEMLTVGFAQSSFARIAEAIGRGAIADLEAFPPHATTQELVQLVVYQCPRCKVVGSCHARNDSWTGSYYKTNEQSPERILSPLEMGAMQRIIEVRGTLSS